MLPAKHTRRTLCSTDYTPE